ncbi:MULTISPECIES: nuclear transport factor 2 family protein [unclassified Nonomuraea]|uniref:nuclear transport factor 2 family protein n=1 Tax=unclassified Nonomuraea TaxID=2593643 RepID=UPI0033E75540
MTVRDPAASPQRHHRAHADAIDAFIAAANADDPDHRSALLSRALAADVVFWGPLGRGSGRGAVADFVTEVVQGYRAGGCRMVRTTSVDAPHEWARFGWRFEGPDGATVLSGTDMVHLTAAGDIDEIVVFAGPLH